MAFSDFRVLTAIGDAEQISPLLTFSCALARARDGAVTALCVTPDGERPEWLQTPSQCGEVSVRTVVRGGGNAAKVILEAARTLHPDLLVIGWRGSPGQRRYLLGSTLDPVTQYAPCDVAVLRIDELGEIHRALVPVSTGPNAPLALELALSLSDDVCVTALNVARASLGATAEAAGYEQLRAVLEPWSDSERVVAKVVRSQNIVDGILKEASEGYDIVLIGASNESYIDRKLFGNVPQTIAADAPVPTAVVRHRVSPFRILLREAGRRLSSSVRDNLTVAQQVETYRQVRRGARARPDFFVLISLAAALATLGLLMDSPEVIIGAMVIAPLMSAILGISLGVVQGDLRLLWSAANTSLRGAGLAILIGTGVGLVVPGRELTPEILNYIRPALFDLGVALFAGVVGAYAQCRRGVLSALSGVAIAVSLVPPLATVGIGITMLNWTVVAGALLLFLTNLSAIVAMGSVVFLAFGFRPDPGRRFLVFERSMIGAVVLLLIVSIVLTTLTVSSVRSTGRSREIQETLAIETQAVGELDTWQVREDDGGTLYLQVQVRTTRTVSRQEIVDLQQRIALRLRRPVALALSVVPVTELEPWAPSSLNTPTPNPH